VRFSAFVLLPLLAAAVPAAAQFAPSPRASPRPKGPEPIKGLGDDVKIRSDKTGGEHGHTWWEGFVDMQSGDIRIQADYLEVNENEKPDGTTQRLVHASGNVVFLRGDERLAGETLDLDLDSNFAVFSKASGFIQPGVFVEAQKIERVDEDTYRIESGKFTSCAQPNPRWGFTASRATIEVDDKILAQNVFFKIKSVPALYFPYFYYPIKEDHRATGILMPHIGFSSTRGFNAGDAFFWAMSRNSDQTFYVDHYSNVGWGFGHELRYAFDAPSRGTFTTYLFNPTANSFTDYDLNWTAMQALPGRFRATVLVRKYSSLSFQQQFQDNFNLATSRTQHATLNLQGPLFGRYGAQLQLLADSTDTYFGDNPPETLRRLPSLTLSRSLRRIGRSQLAFGWAVRVDNFGRNNDEVVDYWGRVDVAPELSRSFSNSFLQVTPRLKPRYTWYSGLLDDVGLTTGPPKSRPFMETGLEVRGPQFSRVFSGPDFYTDKIKHVIGPEVNWTYRTNVTDFDKIPKFDGYDQMLGTNQIDYALVNTLYAKRPSPGSTKAVPFQFLTWRVQQSYYVQISDNQQEYDPNYSSVYFAPGGVPTHLSPIQSRLRVRPTAAYALSYDTEYDINFKQTRSQSITGTITTSWLNLNAGWSVTNQVARKVEKRVATSNGLRGQASLKLPYHFLVDAWTTYDFIQSQFLQSQARLRLDSQCCGFQVEVIRYKYNNRDEQQIRFSIDLANIGSIGNFMGLGTGVSNQGLAGFR
jgi:lipopolysaccharide assembly outer membrane protein LptD (OstA)